MLLLFTAALQQRGNSGQQLLEVRQGCSQCDCAATVTNAVWGKEMPLANLAPVPCSQLAPRNVRVALGEAGSSAPALVVEQNAFASSFARRAITGIFTGSRIQNPLMSIGRGECIRVPEILYRQ